MVVAEVTPEMNFVSLQVPHVLPDTVPTDWTVDVVGPKFNVSETITLLEVSAEVISEVVVDSAT